MSPQDYIKVYGVKHAREVVDHSSLFDMYFCHTQQKWLTHSDCKHDVDVHGLKLELIKSYPLKMTASKYRETICALVTIAFVFGFIAYKFFTLKG